MSQLPLDDEPRARVKAPTMDTAELLGRLRRHYLKPGPFPGGVFVTEVGQNAGPNSRRCDALHVGFTSTSGRVLRGHEVKASRSDWLAELKQVDKAGTWADECHEWWVVAPSVEVVKPEELPPDWGLLVPGPSRTAMVVKVRARTHHDRTPAWWAVRSMMARLDTLGEREVHERAQRAVVAALKDEKERWERHHQAVQDRGSRLAEALGTVLHEHHVYDTAHTVRLVRQALTDEATASRLTGARVDIDRAILALTEVRAALTEGAPA